MAELKPVVEKFEPKGRPKSESKSMLEMMDDRRSKELIIGFCGTAGSGVSRAVDILSGILESPFRYTVVKVKVSHFLKRAILNNGFPSISATEAELKNKYRAAHECQNAGNELRKRFGHDILAIWAASEIAEHRRRIKEDRIVYLIDSLKHPAEVHLLREFYGNMFHLFGVICPKPVREKRLIEAKQMSEEEAATIITRDKQEEEPWGQKMVHTLKESDFLVRNTMKNIVTLKDRIDRFARLIMGDPTLTPSIHEFGMYVAQSAALRSSCISKQVGAAIVDPNGNVIATGRNDVPKFGGGLYSHEDEGMEHDARCYVHPDQTCRNSENVTRLKCEILEQLKEAGIGDEVADTVIKEMLSKTSVEDITEFSRAVHAEMDALISVARLGGRSTRDCVLYVTTFPCHNCTRHIIASGINEVYYIEPYEKSRAIRLHSDAIFIEDDPSQAENKVAFLHYDGVAPRQYLKMFKRDIDKKKDDKLIEWSPETARPQVSEYLDAFPDYEKKAVEFLKGRDLLFVEEAGDSERTDDGSDTA